MKDLVVYVLNWISAEREAREKARERAAAIEAKERRQRELSAMGALLRAQLQKDPPPLTLEQTKAEYHALLTAINED